MKDLIINAFVVVLYLLIADTLLAQGSLEKEVTIDIDFESERANAKRLGEEVTYSRQIDEIFRNPVIINGLDTGTEAINRSVESIMDSVFYSLLDNDKRFAITKESWFQLGIRRNLIGTNHGRYIVVDRFYLGPGFQRRLFSTAGVPWVLGSEATGEILQIYLQTDGKRVLEQKNEKSWRSMSNSWFGILPALSSVLPPSFNQNEMYDPITEIMTPVTFPVSVEKFAEMPVGSIRSYNLSGGIRLTPDLAGLVPKDKLQLLAKMAGLSVLFPVSLFKRGEHRINVFRKDTKRAWVGVNEVDRNGLLFEGSVGAIYAVFEGAVGLSLGSFSWVWGGIPIAFTPLNFSYQKALAELFDQVYEFDLDTPLGRYCYERAVVGDFYPAQENAIQSLKGKDVGVTFQFARAQKREEKSNNRGPNLAVYKSVREKNHSKSEIEIKDFIGKYFILEAMNEVVDKNWNILVGESEEKIQSVVEMLVKPNPDSEGKNFFSYENPFNPYRLVINYSIEDRYTNALEFNDYMDTIRGVSGMSLADIDKMPLRSTKKIQRRNWQVRFSSPEDTTKILHISPSPLGRFSAQVQISFPFESFKQILQASSGAILKEVDAAFRLEGQGLSPWGSAHGRLLEFLANPLDMLNLRLPGIEIQGFAERVTASLGEIRQHSLPERQIAGFLQLIDTSYPRQLIKVLLNLSTLNKVSRSVVMTSKSIASIDEGDKKKFAKINGYHVHAGKPFPPTSRYGRIKEKISQFYLDKPRSAGGSLEISHIQVLTEKVPMSVLQGPSFLTSPEAQRPQVYLVIQLDRNVINHNFKLYARLEEAGRLQLGKFDLGETVIEGAEFVKSYSADHKVNYGTFVTGPLSPFNREFTVDLGQKTTQFRVTLAVSEDGDNWGQERSVEFSFDNGVLSPQK